MEYEYRIYPSAAQDAAAVIHTEAPIPGIETGHYLLLESENMSTKVGHNLEIVNVEVYVNAPLDVLQRVVVHVYTRERDRAELLSAY